MDSPPEDGRPDPDPEQSSRAQGPFARAHGPIHSGEGRVVLGAGGLDLSSVGYVEEEFFVEGTARVFTSDSPIPADGRRDARRDGGPVEGALPFRTRIVVRRPRECRGTTAPVLVEWLNVSGGLDADPDWTFLQREIVRSGVVWVGVSAQRDGIVPSGHPIGEMLSLHRADPARYGSLEHPGDDASYDIFTQVGDLVRRRADELLGGTVPEIVVAVGESQSAERLTTYVNAFGRGSVFDAYLLHSRHAIGAPLREGTVELDPTLLRDDLSAPVMVLVAENDVAGERIGFHRARQRDTARRVTWEIAGTAHVDAYGLGIGDHDDGSGASDDDLFAAMTSPPSSVYFGVIECDAPINTGPHTYVARAALVHLLRWARGGEPPPSMPTLELTEDGLDVVRDDAGHALGGVRTPHVDVPIATLSGMGQGAGGFCELFGTTTPFDEAELRRRYPDRERFVAAWEASVDAAVRAGVLLDPDAEQLRRVVREATVSW